MSVKTQNAKIIFGLKVKQLRQEQSLSFAEMSKRVGMSVSYLNEIEKGKKYPKADKVALIADALGSSVEDLTAAELHHELAPVSELLNSNFLNELPLDLFGIELAKVAEIIAGAPTKVGAFIATLVELGQNYALQEANFYFGALRSYLEMHDNYFADLEKDVAKFVKKYKLTKTDTLSAAQLAQLLEDEFNYEIVENGLDNYPELHNLRAVYLPKKQQLLLNSGLNDMQKAFQFGKELGFQYLQLDARANTSSLLRVTSFEEVLSHFKAGYFSAALLINREAFIADFEQFFGRKKWDGEAFLNLLHKYQVTPETLFQRMTNIIPEFFGIKKIFFLRFTNTPEKDSFKVDKELHLNGRHQPRSNGLSEHYCRRWISINLLEDLRQMQEQGKYIGTIVGAQKSHYFDTKDEYLCITLARPGYPTPDQNVSVTIGFEIDETLHEKIRFLEDPAISVREVNKTCERCPIENCTERAAPPTVIQKREKRRKIEAALQNLIQ